MSQNIMLVEGNDDLHVVSSLMMHNNVPDSFKIIDSKGIDSLISLIPIRVKSSGVEVVGAVVDADFDLSARWSGIKNALSTVGYTNIPNIVPHDGLIIESDGLPIFGLWVMPNNIVHGMLEDLVALLAPQDCRVMSHVNRVMNEMPEDVVKFATNKLSKVRIHTWLAWQDDPGTPMGLAITKKYLQPSCPEADRFVAWVKSLYKIV